MEPLLKAARWVGLSSSLLTLVLGVVHLCRQHVSIHWPSKIHAAFLDDVQQAAWRTRVFTLAPDYFLECWTPVLVGLIGVACHSNYFRLTQKVTSNFGFYFVFLMIQALFANIGYRGGLGILVSVVSFVAALLALIAGFMERSASAALQLGRDIKHSFMAT
ncbi:putative transmembrane protein [Gregarina niphandrodes]|uniref:Transmembrane protein n=1 Tax=Gregarina niphandrodes TaxID=110365 RepID=A0A023B1B7_GRENI|nr:putative transmembrane protein [Gregarina niphandrodes]EZG46744.1 putative transmembrane protein [Gregarina niphandrodes]|eukprot:XP_011132253.1 putative transmembrane protein [Gregarina niphandrodes]